MSSDMGKGRVEDRLSLDIRAMRRRGALVPGGRGTWQWSRRDKPAGQVLFEVVAADRLRLRYRLGSDDKQVLKDYHIGITWTPCHLGGARPWFLCPRCGSRVAYLYLRSVFACRSCQGLNYAGQQAGKAVTALDRSLALRRTVGTNEGPLTMGADWIVRPKGMHRQTFARKLEQIKRADARAISALGATLARG